MKLFSPKIKNFRRKLSRLEKLKKIKRILPEKISVFSKKSFSDISGNFLVLWSENFIFSQKKAFLTFQEMELSKKTYILGYIFPSSKKISFVSRNGTFWPKTLNPLELHMLFTTVLVQTTTHQLGTLGCCNNRLLSRFPWEQGVLPWSCRASHLWFKTQIRPIYLNRTVFGKGY